MRMIREGDLNYKSAVDIASTISSGTSSGTTDPVRHAKTSTIVFSSLCTRAAIEGGLSPELAYPLGDTYISAVEKAKTIAEIGAISRSMYEEFIQRVHNIKTNLNVSKPVRICCEYIEQNSEDELSIDLLAKRVGYTKYYLSRRFKEEMGITVNEYINAVRVERAKYLLSCTDLTLQEVADQLHFCSRSYFGKIFRSIVGTSATEYRKEHT